MSFFHWLAGLVTILLGGIRVVAIAGFAIGLRAHTKSRQWKWEAHHKCQRHPTV